MCEQKYIRTLPKYGYQFVASHQEIDGEQAAPATQATHIQKFRHHYFVGAVVLIAAFLLPKVLMTPEPPAPLATVLVGSRPLTSAPGLEHQPRVVPGGDWVVHAVMRRDRSDWDLFRVSLSDGTLQPVAVTPDVHEHGPAISPFGDELAYVRLSDEACDVVVQSITLGVPEAIAQCTQKFATLADWSPTNNLIAYTAPQRTEPDGLRRIYTVDKDSGDTRQVTDAVSPTGTDFYPRFSPSGNKLAFLRGEPQPDHRSTLWVVDVQTGTELSLTNLPAQLGGMTWLDEERLFYSTSDAGSMQGRIVNTTSGETVPVESNDLVHPEYVAV